MTALEELGGEASEVQGLPEGEAPKGSSVNGIKNRAAKEKNEENPAGQIDVTDEKTPLPVSEAQIKAIRKLADRKGYDENQLNKMTAEMFGRHMRYLSADDAASLIVTLQRP